MGHHFARRPRILILPVDALARIRWFFLLASLVATAFTLPLLAFWTTTAWPMRAVAAVSIAILGWRWIRQYAGGTSQLAWDLAEGVLLCTLAVTVGLESTVGTFFLSILFHNLYPTMRHAVVRFFIYSTAYLSAAALAPPAAGMLSREVLINVTGFALYTGIMQVVTEALLKHERAMHRETTLREAAVVLTGAGDRDLLYAAAQAAFETLLAEVAGARATIMLRDGDSLVRADSSSPNLSGVGDGRGALANLPASIHDALWAGQSVTLTNAGTTSPWVIEAMGASTDLVLIPLIVHDTLQGAIAVASLATIPPELDGALAVLGSQLALASDGMLRVEDRYRREGEARLRALVQNTTDVIFIVGGAATITYVSDSLTTVLGYHPSEILCTDFRSLMHAEDVARAQRVFEDACSENGARAKAEERLRHKDGTWHQFELISTNLSHEPSIGGIVITAHDVTERKLFEKQLQHLAFHDPLTALPNRALFMERLAHAIRRLARHGGTVAVLFLDLDNFKRINDRLGHAAGDDVLTTVAERLSRSVRPGDTVARFGGDEFAILLEDTAHYDAAIALAARVIEAVQEPMVATGQEVLSNASVGIAMSGTGHDGVEELLRNADVAMYMAKNGGKGSYAVFDQAAYVALMGRETLEADLKHAVEREELVLHYQPIVDLETGALVGMEALLRWNHPERGLLLPETFISLAEETGQIVPIEQWVLGEACRQTRTWHHRYLTEPPRQIAINLSGAHIQQMTVVSDIAKVLEETGIDPECVILEITESVMMRDTEATIDTLQALKRLGISLALDDFGTGYSSLSYLQQFPIDVLKIDRSFVSGAGTTGGSSALARAVILLGQALDVPTIAEGVEEAEQLMQLQALGCERAQGYYFSPPVGSVALEALLEQASRGIDWRSRASRAPEAA